MLFFHSPDGVEKLVQAGVTGIIQPYGSIRDKEIIDFANKTSNCFGFFKNKTFQPLVNFINFCSQYKITLM